MRVFGVTLLIAVMAARGTAQCPNGAPPPCPVLRVAAVNRPLDDRNWLVLPFDNIARDPSLEVVRDVSVTLLYSAMSQWSDILVVDDTRVADLMRGVPANTRLGQEAAFELARRVGAGKLVMGTLLKEGPRTRLQAAVFDVRSGQRLRSPSLMTVGTDSLSTVFAGLAQQVLAVPAPSGVRPTEVGTQNTEALRAYTAGLEAERRLAQDSATMHYRRAVAIDSSFGLAHYHLFLSLADVPDQDPEPVNRALEAAQRFAVGLPRRERSQVAAIVALRRGDINTRCRLVDEMLATDSLDAWAWWAHGQCRYQRVSIDSSVMSNRYATDNARLADWRRAMSLDSSFSAPIQSMRALLNVHSECRTAREHMACADADWHESTSQVDHDTLVIRLHRPYMEGRAYLNSAWAVDGRRQRALLARDAVSRFLIANPQHVGAHFALANILMRLGDFTGAERELVAARGIARLVGWRRLYYVSRFSLELKRQRLAAASAFADSVYYDPTAGISPQPGSIVGRYTLDANAVYPASDPRNAMRLAWLPVFAGVLPADWDQLVARYAEGYAQRFPEAQREIARRGVVSLSTLVAFFMRRTRPAIDTAHPDPIYRFQAWFALGDTARARRALGESDAEIDIRPAEALDDGAWVLNAEGHVLLADSVAALGRLRDWASRWARLEDNNLAYVLSERGVPVNTMMRAHGRHWLLYADLAAAAGSREEARKAYQFVVDLWQRGEAPVQPLVARARAALARLRP